jgi:clan AA aspartic protease (TIGR02281 family)
MFFKSIIFAISGIIFFVSPLKADTIYLKNGRTIEGFILEETPESVQVDVGFGKVGLKRSEIESFSRSDDKDSDRLRAKWLRQKNASIERAKEEKIKDEASPKHATIADERGQMVVEVLLNKKVKASLILDTGASLVVIKDSVAKQLGLAASAIKEDLKIKLADGRESTAKHVVIPSVSVQGVEAQNVDAAVLTADIQDPALKDGLLGMTYLRNFSFKIDQRNKKLTLEKF